MTLQEAYDNWSNTVTEMSIGMISYEKLKHNFETKEDEWTVVPQIKNKRHHVGVNEARDQAWFIYCDVRDGLPIGRTRNKRAEDIMGWGYSEKKHGKVEEMVN